MSIVVQKFGGTSVADAERISRAAMRAVETKRAGHQVVMVVSARGKKTDELVSLAAEITKKPRPREMDMLLSTGEQESVALMAMAVHELGEEAISLTGAQIGVKTDGSHTKARIISISTQRMKSALDAGQIVIAAGFQGVDEDFDITTLGRGGSDTTAAALAAVLDAEVCEIYTDVEGVFTTDPRVVTDAAKIEQVSYDEMLELASLGAGVMHSRSIEFAKKYHVNLKVKPAYADGPGTLIAPSPADPAPMVTGVAFVRNEARVSLIGVPDQPGVMSQVFSRLSESKIPVDMVVQNVGKDGLANVSFTVPRTELKLALKAITPVAEAIGAEDIESDDQVSKVSAVGLGMAQQVGVANKMFRALSDADINLQMITTSEIKISVLVSREQALQALRSIHQAFTLDTAPSNAVPAGTLPTRNQKRDAVDVVARLQDLGMEDLMIHEITLDDTQGAVSVTEVPNKPGIAASIFDRIAEANVFVDMIVQSYSDADEANLTFTAPRSQIDAAYQVASTLVDQNLAKHAARFDKIAKLSVSGIGLRSHTSVGSKLFEALADAKINIRMMSTSEVRFNVVVDGDDGPRGLEALQKAFADYVS